MNSNTSNNKSKTTPMPKPIKFSNLPTPLVSPLLVPPKSSKEKLNKSTFYKKTRVIILQIALKEKESIPMLKHHWGT